MYATSMAVITIINALILAKIYFSNGPEYMVYPPLRQAKK